MTKRIQSSRIIAAVLPVLYIDRLIQSDEIYYKWCTIKNGVVINNVHPCVYSMLMNLKRMNYATKWKENLNKNSM